MQECPNKKIILDYCNCSYPSCSKKGTCCECIRYHLSLRQLPACVFPEEAERSYDRSFENFAQLVISNKI